jgi:hypothetical protein
VPAAVLVVRIIIAAAAAHGRNRVNYNVAHKRPSGEGKHDMEVERTNGLWEENQSTSGSNGRHEASADGFEWAVAGRSVIQGALNRLLRFAFALMLASQTREYRELPKGGGSRFDRLWQRVLVVGAGTVLIRARRATAVLVTMVFVPSRKGSKGG